MTGDATADRILEVLEEDAKASYADLAERAEVSKPTVRKYVDELESEGVIVGYSADVDPKKLANQTIALVGLDVASERYVGATRELESLPEIDSLYSCSGDHMFLAEVRAENSDAVGDVISDVILAVEGVTEAHPCFLQERLK